MSAPFFRFNILSTLLVMAFLPVLAWGQTQLVHYSPSGSVDSTLPFPATTVTAPMTSADPMTLTGATGGTWTNSYYTRLWSNSAGPDLGEYIEFSVTGNWNAHSVQHAWFGSSFGPNAVAIRSNLDSYAADIATAGKAGTVSLDISSLGALTGTTTFRLYYYGGSNGPDPATTDVVFIDGVFGLQVFGVDEIPPSADLQVTKTDGVTSAVAGESITYTIVASNAGPLDVPDATVVDNFPALLTCTYTSVAAGGATGNTAAGAGNLNENLSLPSGSSVTYTAGCSIPSSAGGTLLNTANISSATIEDPDDTNNSATDNDTAITAVADLSVEKVDSADPVVAGGPDSLVYTVTVDNAGPSDAATVVATDTLPAGVTLVGTSGCAEDPNGVPGCALGTIAAGGSAQYTIEVTVDSDAAAGTITNSVTVSSGSDDPDADNNTTTEDTVVERESDLSITKVGDVDPVTAGNELTYTIDVSNAGPSVADDVVITDTLPAGTNLVASTGCDESPAGGVPTCTVGTIADGASAQVTLTVLVDNAVAAGATLTNAVTVESASTDPTPGDNAASEATAVIRVAVWEVTKVWEDGGPVDVQLDCSDSLTPVDTAMTGGAQNSATLTHTAFADGVDCVVTETVPLGQAPTYVGDCDVTDIVSGGDAYTCMITNNTSEARILVTKWFSDDSESEVSVTVECNDGFISQDGTATVMGGDPAGHTFIITDFIDGALDCTVTESGGPSGYVSSPVLGYEFLGMDSDPGFYEARFDNAAMPATYTVTKEWMITNDGGDEVQKEVYVTIECESSIMPEKPIAAKELAECLNGCNYTKSGWLGDGDMLTAVVSTYSGPAMCKAYEGDVQSGVDVENGCEDYKTLTAGESYGCTIYNSVFFEGIPTLSQYGLALMALLMLGVGFIGFRRFI